MRPVLFLIILALTPNAFGKANEPIVATVTDLRGHVGHQRNLGAAWSDTSLDEAMFLLDLIRTGKRSTTEMRFIDRTLLALGEKTRMKITVGLFNLKKTEPQMQAAIKKAQLRLASQSKKHSLTQSNNPQKETTEVVKITLAAGSLTLAVDFSARFYRVEGPNEQVLFIAPGDRVRVSIVDGKLVVESIPQGFQFAAEFLFDAWDEELFGPESAIQDAIAANSESGTEGSWSTGPVGSNPDEEGDTTDAVPGSLNPLDALSLIDSTDTGPTGVLVEVSPRGDEN